MGDEQRQARLNKILLCRDQDELATGSTNVMQLLERRAEKIGSNTLVERDEEDYDALKPMVDHQVATGPRRSTAASNAAPSSANCNNTGTAASGTALAIAD